MIPPRRLDGVLVSEVSDPPVEIVIEIDASVVTSDDGDAILLGFDNHVLELL